LPLKIRISALRRKPCIQFYRHSTTFPQVSATTEAFNVFFYGPTVPSGPSHSLGFDKTSVSPVRFEPPIPASEPPQTPVLDRAANGNGFVIIIGGTFLFPVGVRLCPVFSINRPVASAISLATMLKSGAASAFLRRCKRMISTQRQISLSWRKSA